jgi:hypothetical protein
VERLQFLIEEVERQVHRLAHSARDRLDGWLSEAGEWLDSFEAPPHGSRGWLEVQVPGL